MNALQITTNNDIIWIIWKTMFQRQNGIVDALAHVLSMKAAFVHPFLRFLRNINNEEDETMPRQIKLWVDLSKPKEIDICVTLCRWLRTMNVFIPINVTAVRATIGNGRSIADEEGRRVGQIMSLAQEVTVRTKDLFMKDFVTGLNSEITRRPDCRILRLDMILHKNPSAGYVVPSRGVNMIVWARNGEKPPTRGTANISRSVGWDLVIRNSDPQWSYLFVDVRVLPTVEGEVGLR